MMSKKNHGMLTDDTQTMLEDDADDTKEEEHADDLAGMLAQMDG